MHSKHCSSILVVEDGEPVGIWTESDALRMAFDEELQACLPISEVMSSPIKTIPSDSALEKAGILFNRYHFRHFLVVDENDAPNGILSQTDVILHSQAEHFFLHSSVGSIMEQLGEAVPGDMPVRTVMKMMFNKATEVVIVEAFDNQEPGIITERDIINLIAEGKLSSTASEVASRPLITIPHNASLSAARDYMKTKFVRHLVITGKAGDWVGLLSFSDFLRGIQYNYFQRLEKDLQICTENLREREERYRNLVEKTSDWLWEVNKKFVYTYVNPKVRDILGYEPEDILGKTLFDFMPPAEGIQAANILQAIAREQETFNNFENINIRKDGQFVTLETSAVPILSEEGKYLGYRGISRNISERIEAETERRNLKTLTPREREVLELVINGQTNKGIARELAISKKTVELHRSRVMHKMQAKTLACLIKKTLAAHSNVH